MKKIITAMAFAIAGATAASAQAQADEIVKLQMDTRLDYQRDYLDGTTVKDNTGFEGKFLNIRLDGNINDQISYSWRQRLNKKHSDGSFFDATDWIYLNYKYDDRWSFSAGKEVVKIGSWEYDRAPIDIYAGSVFWNNIPCYQIGGSATYKLTASDALSIQFCQSPFFTETNRDLYSYNLYWQGSHGILSTIWSANLIEYQAGHYISYLSLGNRFNMGNTTLEFDIMNRASSHQGYFFKDCSLMGELSFRPSQKVTLHAKGTYDVNHSGNNADFCVLDGTELTMAGGGIEYYPLRSDSQALRIHASCYYSWGKNANPANSMQDKSLLMSVGIKWNMNLLSLKRN